MATAPGYVPGPTTYIPGSSPTLASTPTQHAPGPPTQVSPAAATRVSPAAATRASAAPPIPRPAPAPAPPSGSKTGLLVGLLAGGFVLLLAVGVAAFLFLRPRPSPSPGLVAGPPTTSLVTSTTLAAPAPSGVVPSAATSPASIANAEPTVPAATTPLAGRETPAPPGGGGHRGKTEPAVAGGAAASGGPKGTTGGAVAAAEPESILDREPPAEDGRAAGDRAAGTYRESRGGGDGSFGTNRRFQARSRFPRTSDPAERRAIFVLLNVISFEEAFQKGHGRYGNFKEVLPGGESLPQPNAFQRHGYRFELQADKGEFRVVATPLQMGLRPFVADDSGIVRLADE
jgi:hypothetical protein